MIQKYGYNRGIIKEIKKEGFQNEKFRWNVKNLTGKSFCVFDVNREGFISGAGSLPTRREF